MTHDRITPDHTRGARMSIVATIAGLAIGLAPFAVAAWAFDRIDQQRNGPPHKLPPRTGPRPTWQHRQARLQEYRASRHHHMR